MDFVPNEEQLELQRAVHTLCARHLPPMRLRELIERGGWDDELWKSLHEMGVAELRRPIVDGGLGLGLADTAMVFEELGAALVPGPVLATHLVWTHLGDSESFSHSAAPD
jgi:alkylation response protein AidB-like acyl-CoA dehydrogenase